MSPLPCLTLLGFAWSVMSVSPPRRTPFEMTAVQNEPCRATTIERVHLAGVEPSAAAPLDWRRRRRSHPRRERRAARGPDRRVGTGGVELPELRVHVRDRRHERRPDLRVLPPERTKPDRASTRATSVEVERGQRDRRARASGYPTPRVRRAPPPDRVSRLHGTAASRNAAGTRSSTTLASRTRAIADVSSRSRSSRIDDTAALSGVCPPWISVASVTPPASAAGTSRSRTSAGIPAWSRTSGNPSALRSLDLRAQEGDRLVRRHQSVHASHEVGVPAERRRLQIVFGPRGAGMRPPRRA